MCKRCQTFSKIPNIWQHFTTFCNVWQHCSTFYSNSPHPTAFPNIPHQFSTFTNMSNIPQHFKHFEYLNNLKNESPDFARKKYVRIFNNSSFKEGGRFYNPWWQQIKNKKIKFVKPFDPSKQQ